VLIVPLGTPAAEDPTTTGVVAGGGGGGEAVTGHTVVETAIMTVVTEPTGQLVTVAGHFVMVEVKVV